MAQWTRYNLCSSPNDSGVMEFNEDEMVRSCSTHWDISKFPERISFTTPRCRWEKYIKFSVKGMGRESEDWTKWRALKKGATKFQDLRMWWIPWLADPLSDIQEAHFAPGTQIIRKQCSLSREVHIKGYCKNGKRIFATIFFSVTKFTGGRFIRDNSTKHKTF
jgi:hypothetical protein